MSLPLHYITVSGVQLQYLEITPLRSSDGPPFFLLHQLLGTAQTLAELISHLPPGRRIVALDILSISPEHGPLDLTASVLSALIANFLQAIDLANPVIIGHSYGGELALWLACVHAVPLTAIALLAPAHPFGGYRPHVVAFYLTRWGRFLALCIPLAPRFAILWAYNQAAGPTGPITLRHLEPHLRVLRNRNTLRRVLQILSSWETDMCILRNSLLSSHIAVPTLLLWGDQDVVVPPDSAIPLEKILDHSERVNLQGCGHLLPEEAPDVCAKHIQAWLRRLNIEHEDYLSPQI